MRALASLLAVLCLAAPAGAWGAAPRTSLIDLEDEVMCVECGTALNVSQSPFAQRERAFIRREIDAGKTKQQIKHDLVDRFGPSVLASPEASGFDLAAWVVPALLVLVAAAGIVLAVRRWRGGGDNDVAPSDGSVGPTPTEATLDDDDARRLDAELAVFDA